MALFSKNKKEEKLQDESIVSVYSMEKKFEDENLVEAAKDLKLLLEYYAHKKKKNHRYKGRNFIYFILSNKHKNLKNSGYVHWQNINSIIQLNHKKVYPYHQTNLRNAMDFFKKEVKSINTLRINVD